MSREDPHRCETCPTIIRVGRGRYCPECRHRVWAEAALGNQGGYRVTHDIPDDWRPCSCCGLWTALSAVSLCAICEYEKAHPGHTVWGCPAVSQRTPTEATMPIRGCGGIQRGSGVSQIFQWRGVSREAAG